MSRSLDAIGFGDQVEFAFQLESDVALKIVGDQRPASRAISAAVSR